MEFKKTAIVLGAIAAVAGLGLMTAHANAAGTEFGITDARADKDASTYVHKTFANQVKAYHKVAPSLWPKNKDVNQYAIINGVDDKKFWMVTPTGKVSDMTEKEALSYDIDPQPLSGWFLAFNAHGKSGAFMAVTNEELHDTKRLVRYPHLGTYDLFITYVHEMFHATEQDSWQFPKKHYNLEHDEYMKHTDARRVRLQLQEQLMAAYTNKSEKSLAQALATYRYYKQNYEKDYKATFEDDRLEGTAYYYEIRSSLFAGYPDKVKTMKQNDVAVRTLFKQNRLAYLDSGAYAETYNVGALASFVLDWQADKQGISRDTWKKAMDSAKTNPMDYLDKHAKIFYIPPYKATMTNAEYKTMYKKIMNYKNLAE